MAAQSRFHTPKKNEGEARSNVAARRWVAMALSAWFVCAWCWLRPHSIAADWMGWRQCDTQTIALHLTEPGSSIWYPRIDWGGDGPGYVETEFQLYPAIVALLLRLTGPAEWPGQLISLLSMSFVGWYLFGVLADRYGERRAAFGTAAFFCAPSVMLTATSIQPEALCTLLSVLAWRSFLRWEARSRIVDIVGFGVFGAMAMMVKPTAAQLGVASFVVVLLRSRIRRLEPWIVWALILAALGAYLLHARSLYLTYHNTFGILSGGDTKLPRGEHLMMIRAWIAAARTNVLYGLGIPGSFALAVLMIRRRLDAPTMGLLAGCVVWSIVAMRYVISVPLGGSHYVILAALVAGHAVAQAIPEWAEARSKWQTRALIGAAAALLLAFSGAVAFRRYRMLPDLETQQVLAVGHALRPIVRPGELIVVRSAASARDPFWKCANNFEDPRVFYLSHTHGWVLALDLAAPERLASLASRGARYYVESRSEDGDDAMASWLDAKADLVATTPLGGRVFRLGSGGDPEPSSTHSVTMPL